MLPFIESRSDSIVMRITLICCPFKTSYGWYADSLKKAIERKTGSAVQWVASNCGCGDPIEVGRQFLTCESAYFELPHVVEYQSKTAWKRWLRVRVRHFSYLFRAKRYGRLSKGAELVHFQQILNAYGSSVVFHWLNQRSTAAKVVTIHELDNYQTQFPEKNRVYNEADAIIVHCNELKEKLVGLKVQPDKIHVILQGTDVPKQNCTDHREGVIFYGGHKLMTGKGIQNLFEAMSMLKARSGMNAPKLKIHGHYGDSVPMEAKQLAERFGVASDVVWLNQLSIEDIVREYQTNALLVLPYTGSFAGLPAAIAAANGLPVVCTRKAGIPEHLGECGVWIDEANPKQLAESMANLLSNEQLRREIGVKLRKRAELLLSWDTIAGQTLELYESCLRHKRNS